MFDVQTEILAVRVKILLALPVIFLVLWVVQLERNLRGVFFRNTNVLASAF